MNKLSSGTIKRLHVDRRVIASDRKNGTHEPALTIQTSKGSIKATRLTVHGPSSFIYRPDKPLSCGARAWLETRAEISYE